MYRDADHVSCDRYLAWSQLEVCWIWHLEWRDPFHFYASETGISEDERDNAHPGKIIRMAVVADAANIPAGTGRVCI